MVEITNSPWHLEGRNEEPWLVSGIARDLVHQGLKQEITLLLSLYGMYIIYSYH